MCIRDRLQAAQYSDYLNEGTLVGLLGNMSPTKQPTGNVFPTSDGQIQITALTQLQVEKLFLILGIEDRLSDERFSTISGRVNNSELVADCVTLALAKNNTSFWLEALAEGGVPVAEVRAVPDVIKDPQFGYRGVFESFDSPISNDDQITLVKAGYITDQDGPMIRSKPPRLGEHSEEILTEAGFTEEDINSFRESGAV